jgi:tetratricopeptide (TPR) repeat protein
MSSHLIYRPRRMRAAILFSVVVATLALMGSGMASFYQKERDRWLSTATVGALKGMAEKHPDDTEVAFRLAYRLTALGQTDEATAYMERLVRREPRNVRYWFGLARTASASGKPFRSEEAYREVLKLDSRNAEALFALGGMYSAAGLHHAAIREFEAGARFKQPEDGPTAAWATSLAAVGRNQEAWDRLYVSLKRLPMQDAPFLLLGELAEKLDRIDEAMPLMRVRMDAMRVYPCGFARAPLARLTATQQKSRDELIEAEQLARTATKDGSPRAAYDDALGDVLVLKKDFVGARQAYLAGLKREPGHPECARGLLRVLRRMGRAAEADRVQAGLPRWLREEPTLNALQGAARRNPSPAAFAALAAALEAAGRPDWAAEACEDGLRQFAGDVELSTRLARDRRLALQALSSQRAGAMRNVELEGWVDE